MATHSEERPHVCVKRNKAFNDKPNLARHLKIHSGELPHVLVGVTVYSDFLNKRGGGISVLFDQKNQHA